MASNDIEVLDPAATVEKLKKIVSGVELNRRHFMAALGVAGVAAGTGLVSSPVAHAQQPKPSGYAQVEVLNFLLNIKYLKATFYSYLTQGADLPANYTPVSGGNTYTPTIGSGQIYNQPAKLTTSTISAQFIDMLNEMYYDDLNQLIDLQTLLGIAVVARPTMNLLGTSGANATFAAPAATTTLTGAQALGLARMLEDTSVTAFAGALAYLTGNNLAYAAQALAVDGAHASALRLASIQTGAPYQGTAYVTTFQVATSSGSTSVYAIGAMPATVLAGQAISGTGIPSGAVITAITSSASATPTGIVKSGTTSILAVTNVSGLVTGMPITGTGIPALTYITAVGTNTLTISANVTATPAAYAPTGYVTSGSTTITGVSSASGLTFLTVGQPITGTGIPSTATITAASGTTITMSVAATATSAVSTTGVLTTGSNTITAVSSNTGLATGQTITGTGITAGTTITAIGATTLTMSANATASSPFSSVAIFSGIVTSGKTTISLVSSTTGLLVGQPLAAPGITPGTTVSAIGTNTVTMSANGTTTSTITPAPTGLTTLGSPILTAVSSLAGVITGQPISGTGIATGATIVSSTGSTITMSANATVTGTVNVNLTIPTTQAIYSGGQVLTSPTTQAVSSPSFETITIGKSALTISLPAGASSSTTAIVVTTDPLDVAPVDPGTAALAAAGPAVDPSSSPKLYQGFFATAGSANATGTTPAGFAFVRTFSQVLAVLYGSTTAQTYEGGFFPVGVSGPINVV